jgi:glycosyltransferase involved in cell wall biosynthesis
MPSHQKIKVLLLVNRLALGGPLIHACMLGRELGDTCEIILAGGPPLASENLPLELFREHGLQPMLLKHLRRGIHPVQDILAIVQLYLFIRKFKPDILHSHASKAGFAGRIAARMHGHISIVHTFHGNVFSGYFNALSSRIFIHIERLLSRISDVILSISPSQHRELCDIYRIAPAPKVKMIPLGIRPVQSPDKVLWRKKCGINPDTLVIGFVGRIEDIKNPLLFADAFASFSKQWSKPTVAIVIGDGSLTPRMIQRFQQHHIKVFHEIPEDFTKGVAFLSWKYPSGQFFQMMDIFALTSRNEGTPLSIMEAMSHGLAVVSARVGGVEDLIDHGINGLLVNSSNPEDFTTSFLQLAEDKKLRSYLAKNAHNTAITRFSSERMCEEIFHLYQALSD